MNGPLKEKWLLYKVVTKRDSEAFGILYNTYIERIYRFVYFKLGSKEEAEDATNDIFLRVWRYLTLDTHKRVQSFSGLLYFTARNVIIDIYREKAKRPTINIDEPGVLEIKQDSSLLEEIDLKSSNLRVEKHLRRLKQEYQEIIILRYIEELSVSEIATMLGKKQINVRVILHRALKKLKALMDEKP